jgi:16S rRNA (cytosine967-C5)-methyltransferase
VKLFRGTTEAVIQALEMIFIERKYADKVIEKVLKQNSKWGARDRRFIAETTYNIVRWYRWLTEVSESEPHDFWKLLATYFYLRGLDLPPWEQFSGLNKSESNQRRKELEKVRKVRQSIPDWLDDLGSAELGKRWGKELEALNSSAEVVLRVNTLKTTLGELQENLKNEKVETGTIDSLPDALILKERQNIFKQQAFKNGLFEVQDAASQTVAPFMKVEPGMRVIDACAGAGGKTLHLAALMKNKGRLIAMDVEQWKLDELQKRARRAGVSNLENKVIDSTKAIKRLAGTADRLLLDVPCSGLGVLKRNPDAKWKLSPDFIEGVIRLQQSLVTDYSNMVKPGGMMVYATCSIFPSENEKQVEQFLEKKGNDFSLEEMQHVWPSEGFDGFFMARLKRNK